MRPFGCATFRPAGFLIPLHGRINRITIRAGFWRAIHWLFTSGYGLLIPVSTLYALIRTAGQALAACGWVDHHGTIAILAMEGDFICHDLAPSRHTAMPDHPVSCHQSPAARATLTAQPRCT